MIDQSGSVAGGGAGDGDGVPGTIARTGALGAVSAGVPPPLQAVTRSAAAWAKRNADSEEHTIIGGVRLQADLQPHGLRITPEV
ncbi:hypothetical protein E1292_27410 [Nonomuraea deserti]|uniref:Uncharacterized protein n=1 Tax=Nonomuraea deserti TaxID=1848322 RepID=A0A4R4V8A4_9ACTN|nr:hypothetical protein [Nonomuraea deserti]TDD00941.1 hypothetical protein E1292_27410 [Nonomuraea deserti]